jgi:DNA-binding GntR family transcriptional regulator
VADQTSNLLAGVRLDQRSPVPLYHQAAQELEGGQLPRGSKLEGEPDLAEQPGIGRPAMRS